MNPEFFTVFGQNPAAFTESSAVVDEAFAVRNFGDSQRALGQSIRVENRVYEIASVLNGARFPAKAEIWLRAPCVPANLNRTAFNYRAVARLKTGVLTEQARRISTASPLNWPPRFPNRMEARRSFRCRFGSNSPVRSTRRFLCCWARFCSCY